MLRLHLRRLADCSDLGSRTASKTGEVDRREFVKCFYLVYRAAGQMGQLIVPITILNQILILHGLLRKGEDYFEDKCGRVESPRLWNSISNRAPQITNS